MESDLTTWGPDDLDAQGGIKLREFCWSATYTAPQGFLIVKVLHRDPQSGEPATVRFAIDRDRARELAEQLLRGADAER